ncbi:trypsin-like serine protease [Pelagibius litoralis]|uniref:Trypsin-like serine protease n=1 Tax=Pelagibius litoralis TaxID=374515 RepID=A0A967EXC7_9PROT|nr:trypsin-like serine protease [Pelagibius litoralis]NIA68870.1 trypsin-like serine protease [Pelagibius litoralis]
MTAIRRSTFFVSPAAGHLAKVGLMALFLLLLQACAAKQQAPQFEPAQSPETAATKGTAASFGGRFFADAHEYPWSTLGRVNLAGRGFCNGILIGPQQVLTQAQCLYASREGRWWTPQELHFIAAYQKDRFLADSKVTRFTTAPGYNPAGGISLANLTNNWAVMELSQPIGLKTGWLGLQWNDAPLKAEEARGAAVFLRAGYRADWPHAISLYFGCKGADSGAVNLCEAGPTELALPPFVMTAGELRVVADHFVRTAAQGGALANSAAMTQRGSQLGRATLPNAGSPIRRGPEVSTSEFLTALGYTTAAQDLGGAVRQFLQDQSLPARNTADIAVLTALIATAQSGR